MYKGRRSIISIFVTLCVLSLMLLSITYFLIFGVMKDQRVAQERLIFKVSSSNNILIDIEDCRSAITQYRHAWEKKYLELYLSAIEEITKDVNQYLSQSESFSYDNIQSVRRLSNFLSYQSKLDLGPTVDKTQLYSSVSYILDAFDNHQREIYSVMQKDMNEGYNSYILSADKNNSYFLIILVIFLFFIIILGGVFVIFQNKMIDFLNNLKNNLSQISKQNWEIEDLKNDSYSEFNDVSNSINSMKLKLHDYFLKIERQNEIEKSLAEERLRNQQQRTQMIEAEMTILKSQVNPHFLFNALHQIGMASLITGPDLTMNLVESIGKILRYYLDNSDKMVLLSKELDIVNTYINFQKQTTDVPFNYEIIVEEGLKEEYVLPMCIQPLVENSFKYGFQKKENGGWEIKIRCSRDGDLIRVSVYDNGPGFDVNEIKSSKGIGMANIRKRLTLEYGREDLMKVESITGEYSNVSVLFPKKEES